MYEFNQLYRPNPKTSDPEYAAIWVTYVNVCMWWTALSGTSNWICFILMLNVNWIFWISYQVTITFCITNSVSNEFMHWYLLMSIWLCYHFHMRDTRSCPAYWSYQSCTINSSRPSDAFMSQWTRPLLLQILACCFSDIKALSKPMVD